MTAIHKKARHPNAAKLFVNFLVSEEGQRIFAKGGVTPVNEDIPPKDELKQALEGVKLFNGASGLLARETLERKDEWKERIQNIYR